MNKHNKIHRDQIDVYPRGRRDRIGEGINCTVKDGNQIFGGDHFIVYTDVELRCTHETYNIKCQFQVKKINKSNILTFLFFSFRVILSFSLTMRKKLYSLTMYQGYPYWLCKQFYYNAKFFKAKCYIYLKYYLKFKYHRFSEIISSH